MLEPTRTAYSAQSILDFDAVLTKFCSDDVCGDAKRRQQWPRARRPRLRMLESVSLVSEREFMSQSPIVTPE